MTTITKSIGSSGRDYSTITLWEADLDNGAVYASGDVAQGVLYNDSIFNEAVTINEAVAGLAGIILTVAEGHRHTGIAGTGVRISNSRISVTTIALPVTIEWIEKYQTSGTAAGITFVFGSGDNLAIVSHCLIHDIADNAGTVGIDFSVFVNGRAVRNIVYDVLSRLTSFGGSDAYGIRMQTSGGAKYCYNNTVYKIVNTKAVTSAEDATGISQLEAGGECKNNLICEVTATNGTATCLINSGASATNGTSDTSGTAGLQSLVTADQFVSTVDGAEDLHLITGSDAIDVGTDLGTTPTGVHLDIDGRDVDAMGDVWDLGADEFVPSGQPFRKRWGGVIGNAYTPVGVW